MEISEYAKNWKKDVLCPMVEEIENNNKGIVKMFTRLNKEGGELGCSEKR